MRFLHTSDLHIGLRLCEISMNDVIVSLLDEIIQIAQREQCDAVVIAGDIYDRANPSAEAAAVFDHFVTALAEKNITVIAIAGNHDSPERVAYLSRLAEERGVYLTPAFDGCIPKITIPDAFGDVVFWLLPFVRPVNVRSADASFDGTTYHDAMGFLTEKAGLEPSTRNIMVTHQFVVPGGSSGKIPEDAEEHAVAGGIGAVGADVFEKFDYTALGHLHRPHCVGTQRVNFSGSPVKCSFSEVNDEKSVTVVTVGTDVEWERIPLHPSRDLREMRGTYEELTSPEYRAKGCTEDYLRIILTDEEDIPDAMAKLRVIYPNLLRLGYDNKRTKVTLDLSSELDMDDCVTPLNVFAELYEMQNNTPPDEEILKTAAGIFEDAEKEAVL